MSTPTLSQLAAGFCIWKEDEYHGDLESSCGQTYCFEDEFKVDDSYKFCPSCGKLIQLAQRKEEDEAE